MKMKRVLIKLMIKNLKMKDKKSQSNPILAQMYRPIHF